MKKTLLLSVALMGSMCMFAQTEGTDITPANYKVGNAGVELPFYKNGELSIANINIHAGDIWNYMGAEADWNDGLVALTSGGGLNLVQWQSAMDSWNYIDFGGEIGRVAAFITIGSEIQNVLADLAPNRATEWNDLKVMSTPFGGGGLNFFTDPKNSPTQGWVRATFVLNIFNNEFDANKFIQYISPVNDDGNAVSKWNGTDHNQAQPAGTALNNDYCMDINSGEWDPTKWAKVTIDFKMAAPDQDGKAYTPYRLKMFFMNQNAIENSALFIQDIKFEYFTDGEPQYWNGNVEPIILTQDIANAGAGVESIIDEANAPVEYYNLQGVKVVNPENGIFIRKQGKKTTKVAL